MKGKVVQEATTAMVDGELCTGCARCVEVCPYRAVGMKVSEAKIFAETNQQLCKGCGKCSVACPCRAITVYNFSTDQLTAQIDEALADMPQDDIQGLAMLSNWCAYAGADSAGVSRFQYPTGLIPIRTMCTGRIDPLHVLYALLKGADGVLIGGCHPGDCHYVSGNNMMAENIEKLRNLLREYGFDPRRVRVEWISAAEGKKFAEVVKEFTETLREIGPNPIRKVGQTRPESALEKEAA